MPELSMLAEQSLLRHAWMGNIRELENAIHHALLVCRGDQITPDDLPLITLPPRRQTGSFAPLALEPPPPAPAAPPADPRDVIRGALKALYDQGGTRLWDEIEELVMLSAYQHAEGNQLRTARLLGISRNVVRARLLQFGVLAGGAREGDAEETPPPRFGVPPPAAGPAGTGARC